MARRSDGQVVAWGSEDCGQRDVPTLPAGVMYVEVSAGGSRTVVRAISGAAQIYCTSKASSLPGCIPSGPDVQRFAAQVPGGSPPART